MLASCASTGRCYIYDCLISMVSGGRNGLRYSCRLMAKAALLMTASSLSAGRLLINDPDKVMLTDFLCGFQTDLHGFCCFTICFQYQVICLACFQLIRISFAADFIQWTVIQDTHPIIDIININSVLSVSFHLNAEGTALPVQFSVKCCFCILFFCEKRKFLRSSCRNFIFCIEATVFISQYISLAVCKSSYTANSSSIRILFIITKLFCCSICIGQFKNCSFRPCRYQRIDTIWITRSLNQFDALYRIALLKRNSQASAAICIPAQAEVISFSCFQIIALLILVIVYSVSGHIFDLPVRICFSGNGRSIISGLFRCKTVILLSCQTCLVKIYVLLFIQTDLIQRILWKQKQFHSSFQFPEGYRNHILFSVFNFCFVRQRNLINISVDICFLTKPEVTPRCVTRITITDRKFQST